MKTVLTSAEENIILTFKKNFSHLKGESIVLYGIGEKTKLLIENLLEYNIIGLMDKSSAGYIIHGKPVLMVDEVISKSRNIVIVCNYSSANIIYKRIAHLEKEVGMNIFHMNGNKMFLDQKEEGLEQTKPSFNELYSLILKNEIISFDIFDTVLTRRCIFNSDIFSIVDRKLKEDYNIDIDFTSIRISAEKIAQVNFGLNYTIDDIYKTIQKKIHLDPSRINSIKRLEIQTEFDYAIPRKEILSAIEYAQKLNKKIIFTSDMYLNKEILIKLLSKIGVKGPYELNVSCVLKKSKYKGDLWAHYKNMYAGKKLLHIGDDNFSDIKQAEKYGLTSFEIQSPYEMFEQSVMKSISITSNIDDRLLLGQFIAHAYNNPFSLLDNNKLEIRDMFSVGYLFYGPLISNYVLWLLKKGKELNFSKILFIARDGYIIEKLYKLIKIKKPEGSYFYASRRALAVSSIKTEKDIKDVFRIFYLSRKILFGQFLDSAFGIKPDENDKYIGKYLFEFEDKIFLNHILTQYKEQILANSKDERENYLEYIKKMGIHRDEHLGVINFVSSGVTQYFFENLLSGNKFSFLYFLTKIEMRDINICIDNVYSLYGDYLSSYTCDKNYLIQHFLTAEAVLSAPDETFIRFKKDKVIFDTTDEDRNFTKIAECHKGIENYFKDMIKFDENILHRTFDNELIDNIFGLLFDSKKIIISDKIKNNFSMKDGFAPSDNKKVSGGW